MAFSRCGEGEVVAVFTESEEACFNLPAEATANAGRFQSGFVVKRSRKSRGKQQASTVSCLKAARLRLFKHAVQEYLQVMTTSTRRRRRRKRRRTMTMTTTNDNEDVEDYHYIL